MRERFSYMVKSKAPQMKPKTSKNKTPHNSRGFGDFYLLSGGLQAIRDLIAYLCEDIALQ